MKVPEAGVETVAAAAARRQDWERALQGGPPGVMVQQRMVEAVAGVTQETTSERATAADGTMDQQAGVLEASTRGNMAPGGGKRAKPKRKAIMRSKLMMVDGLPMSDIVAVHWQDIRNFQAKPGDVLIATYPKSGTTWTQEMVELIRHNGDVEKCQRAPVFERIPCLELMRCMPPDLETVNAMPSPRYIKTHLPFNLVPSSFWEHNCKVIYVARNGRDTATSYYHFDRMAIMHPDPGTWDQYLQRFMSGNVGWGSWYDHVKGYWEGKDKCDMLYLFYEDIKQDPITEIRRIMKFLGKKLPDATVEKIAHCTSFNQMKNNDMANYSTFPKEIIDQSEQKFMRKGQVGDWKNIFTVRQNELFEEDYRKKMDHTTLKFKVSI
uniref:Sulfotransferase n=1 Tax=Geotrypetes seraphini TaxID=260995 RepID=A0A6P8SP62_GEOSA|nr:sulfotransferase 1 family member D1-like isoform X2 [Geotrypetes seraphini]